MSRSKSTDDDDVPGSYLGNSRVIWMDSSGIPRVHRGGVYVEINPDGMPISPELRAKLFAYHDSHHPADVPETSLADRREAWILARELARELWDCEVLWAEGAWKDAIPALESRPPR